MWQRRPVILLEALNFLSTCFPVFDRLALLFHRFTEKSIVREQNTFVRLHQAQTRATPLGVCRAPPHVACEIPAAVNFLSYYPTACTQRSGHAPR